MPAWRVTMTFVASQGNAQTGGSLAGWSESWYLPGTLNLEQARSESVLLKGARRGLLTAGWSVDAIRIAQLDENNNPIRRGVLLGVAPDDGRGTFGVGAVGNNEQPYDALNIAVQSANGARRAFLMRGIGDSVVTAAARFANPPVWQGPFTIFVADLAGQAVGPVINAPWALRTRGTPTTIAIDNVLLVTPPGVLIAAGPQRPLFRVRSNTVVAGNQLTVTNVDGFAGVNGSWSATQVQVDPTNVNFEFVGVRQRRRGEIIGEYTGGGRLTYWNWALSNIVGATPRHGASRRTGRPSGITRGRRSNRPS